MVFLIVLGSGALILGIALITNIIQTKSRAQGTANWHETEGQVVTAMVYTHTRQLPEITEITYTPVVTYTYVIDGTAYKTDKRDFDAYERHSMTDKAAADDLIADYQPGAVVSVHYNPANPGQSALVVQRPIAHNTVLWYGIMSIIMGSLIIALGVWMLTR